MDSKMLARLGALVFVAIALTATAIEMTRKETTLVAEPAALSNPREIRCARDSTGASSLVRPRASDECMRVWAQTRDRFLGRSPSPAAPSAEGQ